MVIVAVYEQAYIQGPGPYLGRGPGHASMGGGRPPDLKKKNISPLSSYRCKLFSPLIVLAQQLQVE